MRDILRSGVQRALDHLSNLRIRHCAWATRTIFVVQPFDAISREPPPPFADRVLVDTRCSVPVVMVQDYHCHSGGAYGTDFTRERQEHARHSR